MRWVGRVELKFVFDERDMNRFVAHAAGSAGRGEFQSTRGRLPPQRATVESHTRMTPKSLSGIVSVAQSICLTMLSSDCGHQRSGCGCRRTGSVRRLQSARPGTAEQFIQHLTPDDLVLQQ